MLDTSAAVAATESAIGRLNRAAPQLDLFERVAAAADAIAGRIVFTTGFGVEGQAIAHAILSQRLDIDVVTLDTGRLFPETHEVWVATERLYGRRIRAIVPDAAALERLIEVQGSDGFRHSVEARRSCCHVRKVEPLDRALEAATAWIAGLRGDQSRSRASVAFAGYDSERRVIKINPLFDWSRPQVLDFVREHGVPVSSLHERGFASIGCAPCTRAIRPGEPERAGRWWWENSGHTECGLHVSRIAMPQRVEAEAVPA